MQPRFTVRAAVACAAELAAAFETRGEGHVVKPRLRVEDFVSATHADADAFKAHIETENDGTLVEGVCAPLLQYSRASRREGIGG